MRLAALYSGGKDSTFAVYDSIKNNNEVKYLISIVSKNPESYMFHYPNIKFTRYQAESMNIPWVSRTTKGEKEKELQDLIKAIEGVTKDVDGLLAGGLASKYQYNRIKGIADSLGLNCIVTYSPSTQKWKLSPLTAVLFSLVLCLAL